MHRLDACNLTTSTRFSKQVKPFFSAKNIHLETTGIRSGERQSPAIFQLAEYMPIFKISL
jgi:hypothetical protein